MARVSLIFYIIGSLLVFGSWINVVPAGVGWIGWLMALAGWGVGFLPAAQHPVQQGQPALSKADEISKLRLLRDEDIISEEEFEEGKRRILEQ